MPNSRNPNAKNQDHMLAKSFKIGLLRTNPELREFHGFEAVWGLKNDRPAIVRYSRVDGDFFVLPLTGKNSFTEVLRWIRNNPVALNNGKPEMHYDSPEGDGAIITRHIKDLSVADLIRSLDTLSLVVYSSEDSKKWMHFYDGGRFVVLRSEQLSVDGRLNKVPIKKLLMNYIKASMANGRDSKKGLDMYMQLIDGYRLNKEDIEEISELAIAIKKNTKLKGQDDADTIALRNSLTKTYSRLCKQAKKPDSLKVAATTSTAKAPGLSAKPAYTGPTTDEEFRMKQDSDIISKLWKIVNINHRNGVLYDQAAHNIADGHFRYIKQVYGVADKLLRELMKDASWAIKYPSTMDKVSGEVSTKINSIPLFETPELIAARAKNPTPLTQKVLTPITSPEKDEPQKALTAITSAVNSWSQKMMTPNSSPDNRKTPDPGLVVSLVDENNSFEDIIAAEELYALALLGKNEDGEDI